jgi:predicted RNA-binding protein associated with RNAse of E/G family
MQIGTAGMVNLRGIHERAVSAGTRKDHGRYTGGAWQVHLKCTEERSARAVRASPADSGLRKVLGLAAPGRYLEAAVDLFDRGDTIVLRGLHRDGRIASADSVRVVSDDERGLLTWLARGSQVIRRANLAGQSVRNLPLSSQLRVPKIHVACSQTGRDMLLLTPRQSPYAIAWGFVDGEFGGWYANLQTPARRWWGGIDTHDQALDVLVAADRTWRWKDEDEFTERTGHPLFWDEAGAAVIRGEAERLIALAEAGQFPFDGTWCNFLPDPDWRPTELPWWWDQLPSWELHAWQRENYLA